MLKNNLNNFEEPKKRLIVEGERVGVNALSNESQLKVYVILQKT